MHIHAYIFVFLVFILVNSTPWENSEVLLIKKHFAIEITTNTQPGKAKIQTFLDNNEEIQKDWYLVKCKIRDLAQKLLL